MTEPEAELSNKLAGYAKNDGVNTTADIYAKPESESNLSISASKESTFSTEEEMLESRMSELFDNAEENDVAAQGLIEELLSNTQDQPLPTEDEIENMLTEVRQLEQEEIRVSGENIETKPSGKDDELRHVLSSISSFSAINEK